MYSKHKAHNRYSKLIYICIIKKIDNIILYTRKHETASNLIRERLID